jgi:transposase-like protein
MEPKIKNSSTTSSNPKAKKTRPLQPSYSAQEKAQAILRVWTERCKPSEVCRELKVNWVTFTQWQQRAMEGMLQALEPRVNLTTVRALNPRLQALLLKRQTTITTRKLADRLEQIQLAKPPEAAAKTL